MRTLIQNGTVVNVFTDKLERADVLIEDDRIIGVGDYSGAEADEIHDASGKWICPGFIDGHIHIESTMLLPSELTKACMPHGTTAIVADPHEIANVCGINGISFMIEASEALPLQIYFMLPSCVPATPIDESGALLTAKELGFFYGHPRVLGLAEMMNYPGVLNNDPQVIAKINDARAHGAIINGHAPLLSGHDLDRYIAHGIQDDHECSSEAEAKERISKGQWVMIRQGTSARNLKGLISLFEEPYNRRCLLVTDDKHPHDLIANGHIDSIIRQAVQMGASPVVGIRMATIQAALCFRLRNIGAIAPGYQADINILDDLQTVRVRDVYRSGRRYVKDGVIEAIPSERIRMDLIKSVSHTFYIDALTADAFRCADRGQRQCRVIQIIPGELLTRETVETVNLDQNDGIDCESDRLKIAVCERHLNTGHIGLGWIRGIGIKEGAIASSVSHDSHNLVVVGANETDMAIAANHVRNLGGGCAVVRNGEILSDMPLPIAGLMSYASAGELSQQNLRLRNAVHSLGAPENIEPFMCMAFMCLPVIPFLKITTRGLYSTDEQKIVPAVLPEQEN